MTAAPVSVPVRDTATMLRLMAPRLCDGVYVFSPVSDPAPPEALGVFREDEGLSALLPAASGAAGAMRQITLDVHSALDGVGLTAAVAGALAAANIPCNMVAALHHDHVFVPEAEAVRALGLLQALSATQGA